MARILHRSRVAKQSCSSMKTLRMDMIKNFIIAALVFQLAIQTPCHCNSGSSVSTTSNTIRMQRQSQHLVPIANPDKTTPLNPNKQLATIRQPENVQGTKLWVHDPKECVWISGGLLQKGFWEPNLQTMLMNQLPPQKEDGGKTLFVDIGGNLGTYSIVMAAAGYQVEAFEPLQYNSELFALSIQENGFHDSVKIFNVAVGETPKPKVCLTPKDSSARQQNIGNGQVREDASDIGNNCVPMVRVDSLVSRCPDLVKVDVEGLEVSAIKSLGVVAGGTCRPRAFALEDKHGKDSIVAHLKGIDYTCTRVSGDDYFCRDKLVAAA